MSSATNRHYFRCRDCLGVFVFDVEAEWKVREAWDCSCGSKVADHMGRVVQSRLRIEYDAPACDYRCTGAMGPSCDCSCGGVNHGSGRTVPVSIDGGEIPQARASHPEHGIEWRKAVEDALNHRDQIAPGSSRGAWIPRPQWWAARKLGEALNKARKAKTHKGRMQAVLKCLEIRPDQFLGW